MNSFLANIKVMATEEPSLEKSTPKATDYANKVFRLPIDYLENKHALQEVVATDLELVNTLDDANPSIYACTFCPDTSFAVQILPQFQEHYTTDVSFLIDTQAVVQGVQEMPAPTYTVPCATLESQWTAVKHDPHFMDTYGYLEWGFLKPYNENATVLQSLTLANMLSPLMSFIIPFLFLLFPFVILKIQGIPISLAMYFQILKEIAKNHFIGQAISIFDSFSIQKLIYVFGMLGLYCFQMYQNTMQCLRFYRNIQKMNEELRTWNDFVDHSMVQIEQFTDFAQELPAYRPFVHELRKHQLVLQEIRDMLGCVRPFTCSLSKTTEIGYMLKCYYLLHTRVEMEQTLLFCMGLEGYLQLMRGAGKQWASGVLQPARFVVQDASGTSIQQQFYPPHQHETTCVKNDVELDTYGVITGPNASGKTTYLKTTAINVILTQQLGMGFYKACEMQPYTHIHSYLNIPDTSGRDSLFQAESRRCKNILETIQKHEDGRHFCIFDELYSGTNPHEATKAAYAFLEYLRQYKHVDLFLTTHYVTICDKWTAESAEKKEANETEKEAEEEEEKEEEEDKKKEKRAIKNYKMNVETSTAGKHIPLYTLSPGVSRIEGALAILEGMAYPQEMLSMMEEKEESREEEEEEEELLNV